MKPQNIFDLLRDIKVRQPLDAARQLTKVQATLLAAEDLLAAVEKLELPKDFFLENASVQSVIGASNDLRRAFNL